MSVLERVLKVWGPSGGATMISAGGSEQGPPIRMSRGQGGEPVGDPRHEAGPLSRATGQG